MGWMNQISGMLQQYTGGNTQSGNVEQDYQQVAQHAPPSAIAPGLSNAFRSDKTPPFGEMVSGMFGQSNGTQRAGILNQLIQAAGPGALAGGLLSRLGGGGTVSPEQAQQISPQDVQVLADHAQKQDPSVIDRAGEFYAQHPTLVQGLGVGVLGMIMSHMSQHNS